MRFPFKLLSSADFDVVGFGTNAIDYLITVPEYPVFASKIELTAYAKAPGGEIATTLVGLQRLGAKTAYAGRFGEDEEGKFGLQSFIDEGVNTANAEIVAGSATQIAFIIIDESTGERTVIWRRDAKLGYTANEAPSQIARRCRVLHLTPHDASACVEMAKAAREQGAIVSVDIDNLFDGIDRLLPLVDVVTASTAFPFKFTALADERSALHEIASRFGCGVVGMTRGRGGSIFFCDNAFIETPGFDVPGGCRDTTGAGDAFRTGLLHGLLKGESMENSAVIANAVAALNCRKVGARSGLPTLQELNTLLKNI
jgi:sulfofructose kinase